MKGTMVKAMERQPVILIDGHPAISEIVEPSWFWVLVSANGAAIVRSAEDYRHRSNAVRAARRFAARYLKGRVSVEPAP